MRGDPGGRGRRLVRHHRVLATTVLALLALMLLPVANANAGRLIETGEVADISCDTNPALGGCGFIRAALDYVRSGSPNPSGDVLLFDEPPDHMQNAIVNAYNGAPPFSITELKPSDVNFKTMSITTARFSAIVVASDWTAFTAGGAGGDLNNPSFWPPQNSSGLFQHPWYKNDPVPPGFGGDAGEVPGSLLGSTPDSDALIAPLGHKAITDFYNSGGGILVGSGGDNGDGHQEDLYYDFVNAPRGLIFNGDPSQFTSLGLGLGFTPSDIAHNGANCPPSLSFLDCPQNAFFPLPTGSSLKVAEVDNAANPVTLFQDTDPPVTTITSAPAPLVVTRGPASASFTFSASENLVSFECRLDGGTFTPCSSPASYQNLGEGTHVFSVRAIDAAGNVEAAPPAAVWLVAFDQDGDGYTRFSNPPDCNDNNPNVHPGAPEAAGGTRDSDCDGVIDPFPRIQPHAAFLVRPGARFTEFVRFVVSAVPAGATVEISCFKRRHCPFRRATVKIRHANGRASFTRLLRGRHLPVGLGIAIRITRPGTIGGFELLRLQRLNLPRVEVRCMNPGSRTPLLVCQSFR